MKCWRVPKNASPKSGRDTLPRICNVLGKSMPALPRGFHSAVHRQSSVRQPNLVSRSAVRQVSHLPASARAHQKHRHQRGGEDARRRVHPHATRMLPSQKVPSPAGLRAMPLSASRRTQSAGRSGGIVAAETEDLAEDAAAAIQVDYEVLPFASTLKDTMAPDAADLRGGKGNLLRHAIRPPSSRTPLGRPSKATSKKDSPKPM